MISTEESIEVILKDDRFVTLDLYHRTYNLLIRGEDAEFGKQGLTTQQYGILLGLKILEKPVTVSGLASWSNRTPNSVTTILRRMDENGLIERLRNLDDKRETQVLLTEHGEEAFSRSTRVAWEILKETCSGISNEDWEAFARITQKITENASTMMSPGH